MLPFLPPRLWRNMQLNSSSSPCRLKAAQIRSKERGGDVGATSSWPPSSSSSSSSLSSSSSVAVAAAAVEAIARPALEQDEDEDEDEEEASPAPRLPVTTNEARCRRLRRLCRCRRRRHLPRHSRMLLSLSLSLCGPLDAVLGSTSSCFSFGTPAARAGGTFASPWSNLRPTFCANDAAGADADADAAGVFGIVAANHPRRSVAHPLVRRQRQRQRQLRPPLPPRHGSRFVLSALRSPSSTGWDGNGSGNAGRSGGRRRTRRDDGDEDEFASSSSSKSSPRRLISPERSNFWVSTPLVERPLEDDVVPYEPYLDSDGPLPFGSYRTATRRRRRRRRGMIQNEKDGKDEAKGIDDDDDNDDDDDEGHDVPRLCLITIALDASSSSSWSPRNSNDRVLDPTLPSYMTPAASYTFDAAEAVRNVRDLIDSGFTSFQIARRDGGYAGTVLQDMRDGHETHEHQRLVETFVLGRLRSEMPPSILRECHITTSVRVPPAGGGKSETSRPFKRGTAVREALGASLQRMGGECIDAVQVPYVDGSPYHLDVLNVLSDMQREGTILSVVALNFPPDLLRTAHDCNFVLDTNQVPCNLLDPNPYDVAFRTCADWGMGTRILVESPLAGGLLTNRFARFASEPHPLFLSTSERKHIRSTLRMWADRRSKREMMDGGSAYGRGGGGGGGSGTTANDHPWQIFHKDLLLGTLSDVSRKHHVPIADVALRWSMKLNKVTSVVVSSRVGASGGDMGGEVPFDRHRRLRRLFAFDLDEEDMDRLWDVSGRRQMSEYDEEMARYYSSYWGEDTGGGEAFAPDLSNRKLWL